MGRDFGIVEVMKLKKGNYEQWTHKETGAVRVFKTEKDWDTDKVIFTTTLGNDGAEALRVSDYDIEVVT